MKKSGFYLAATLLAAGHAHAQSAVTLYGIVDQSIRFTNNANAQNGSNVVLTNGAVTNSRFGFKGEEDLGAGMKAIFRLENGFDPQTGQANQNGRLFGRYSYVGLDSAYGTVKLGRQNTEGFNLFGEFDPLTVGNYTANSWAYFITGGRIDNAVSYDGKFGGLNLGATYGFGEQAGSASRNAYAGGRAVYAQGNASIGAVYQVQRDAANNMAKMWGLAGSYGIGAARLFLGYVGGSDATGGVDQALNDSSVNVSYGAFAANPHKDRTLYTGITYQASPVLALTGALYYSAMKNVNGIADNDGRRYTGVLLAEYSLSKRTQLYATLDYNKVRDGAATELPGSNSQTGAALGIRHSF